MQLGDRIAQRSRDSESGRKFWHDLIFLLTNNKKIINRVLSTYFISSILSFLFHLFCAWFHLPRPYLLWNDLRRFIRLKDRVFLLHFCCLQKIVLHTLPSSLQHSPNLWCRTDHSIAELIRYTRFLCLQVDHFSILHRMLFSYWDSRGLLYRTFCFIAILQCICRLRCSKILLFRDACCGVLFLHIFLEHKFQWHTQVRSFLILCFADFDFLLICQEDKYLLEFYFPEGLTHLSSRLLLQQHESCSSWWLLYFLPLFVLVCSSWIPYLQGPWCFRISFKSVSFMDLCTSHWDLFDYSIRFVHFNFLS